jgi:hypothetical protein
VSQLGDALASETGAAPQEAARWVTATLEALGSQGLLDDGKPVTPVVWTPSEEEKRHDRAKAKMRPCEPFTPQAEGRYRLLGTVALIRYADLAQKRMVDAVIGHLQSDETTAPTLVIDIQASHWGDGQITSKIYCNGKPEGRAPRLSYLGPLVKSALWLAAVNAHDFRLNLHAGVVGKGGRCILLPAAAGSGKSSLTAALTHSGFGYYSDEVALVERGTFRISPVPLAICVKSTGWEVMSRYFPQIPSLITHQREDGKVVRYVPPRADAIQKTSAPLSHIFFPLYTAGAPTRLEPMARSEALARLMEQCLAFRLRLDPGSVKELVLWIAGIDCYALTFSSLDEAVGLVEQTLDRK